MKRSRYKKKLVNGRRRRVARDAYRENRIKVYEFACVRAEELAKWTGRKPKYPKHPYPVNKLKDKWTVVAEQTCQDMYGLGVEDAIRNAIEDKIKEELEDKQWDPGHKYNPGDEVLVVPLNVESVSMKVKYKK